MLMAPVQGAFRISNSVQRPTTPSQTREFLPKCACPSMRRDGTKQQTQINCKNLIIENTAVEKKQGSALFQGKRVAIAALQTLGQRRFEQNLQLENHWASSLSKSSWAREADRNLLNINGHACRFPFFVGRPRWRQPNTGHRDDSQETLLYNIAQLFCNSLREAESSWLTFYPTFLTP